MGDPALDLALKNWDKVLSFKKNRLIEIQSNEKKETESIFDFILFCYGYSVLIGIYDKSQGERSFEIIMDRFPLDLFVSFVYLENDYLHAQILSIITQLSNKKDVSERKDRRYSSGNEYLPVMKHTKLKVSMHFSDFEQVQVGNKMYLSKKGEFSKFEEAVLRNLRKVVYGKKNTFPDFFTKYFTIIDRLMYSHIDDPLFTLLKTKITRLWLNRKRPKW